MSNVTMYYSPVVLFNEILNYHENYSTLKRGDTPLIIRESSEILAASFGSQLHVGKYKSILENKKTDAVTSKEKNEAWESIAREFNSSGASCPRDVECLKRCYDNRKKLLRKSLAFQRRELYKTGGGLPNFTEEKQPGDDLLLSIVSKKVMKGMENARDGDTKQMVTPDFSQRSTSSKPKHDNIEIMYDDSDSDIDNRRNFIDLEEVAAGNKRKHVDNISTEKCDESQKSAPRENNWKHYKVGDLKSCTSDALKSFETPCLDTPNPSSEATLSRRRPRTIVKTLTTSDLSQKYDKLLDERLEIAKYQKQHLQNLVNMELKEHELPVELPKAQIRRENQVEETD